MKTYSMTTYAPLFVDKEVARRIHEQILALDPENNEVEIDMTGIESMTTLCAKIIFGALAKSMGLSKFYKQIKFRGLSDEVELILDMGIESAISDSI